MIIPNIWENRIDVPNHQPDYCLKNAQPDVVCCILLECNYFKWAIRTCAQKKSTYAYGTWSAISFFCGVQYSIYYNTYLNIIYCLKQQIKALNIIEVCIQALHTVVSPIALHWLSWDSPILPSLGLTAQCFAPGAEVSEHQPEITPKNEVCS